MTSDWIRWIAVLPAAIAAMALSSIPLHFILYQTLTGSGIVVPYPEVPERVLFPFVAGLTFVWAGATVAPDHQFKTAAILFALWVVLLGCALFITIGPGDVLGATRVTRSYGGLGPVMALVGAGAGLYIVDRQRRSDTSPNQA